MVRTHRFFVWVLELHTILHSIRIIEHERTILYSVRIIEHNVDDCIFSNMFLRFPRKSENQKGYHMADYNTSQIEVYGMTSQPRGRLLSLSPPSPRIERYRYEPKPRRNQTYYKRNQMNTPVRHIKFLPTFCCATYSPVWSPDRT